MPCPASVARPPHIPNPLEAVKNPCYSEDAFASSHLHPPPAKPVLAGYKSVAHYLVLNNLTEEAKPVALERGMCPPELAGALRMLWDHSTAPCTLGLPTSAWRRSGCEGERAALYTPVNGGGRTGAASQAYMHSNLLLSCLLPWCSRAAEGDCRAEGDGGCGPVAYGIVRPLSNGGLPEADDARAGGSSAGLLL